MKDNVVNIVEKDKYISIQNDEIMVKCKSMKELKCCSEMLDAILNEGKALVSIDYMDFIDKPGTTEYDFEMVEGIVLDDSSEYLSKMELCTNSKSIMCIVGNVSFANVSDIMEKLMNIIENHMDSMKKHTEVMENHMEVKDKAHTNTVLFTFVYDEKYQEDKFDIYVWKEM